MPLEQVLSYGQQGGYEDRRMVRINEIGAAQLVALLAVLAFVLTACSSGLSEEDRQLSIRIGYEDGYYTGLKLSPYEPVYWVNPDRARELNFSDYKNKAIPKYYLNPEAFTNEPSETRRRELSDSYNWGFFCGFMVAVGEWEDASNQGCLRLEISLIPPQGAPFPSNFGQ